MVDKGLVFQKFVADWDCEDADSEQDKVSTLLIGLFIGFYFCNAVYFTNIMAKLPIRINAFVRKAEGNERKTLCIKRVPDDGGFWQTVTGTVEDSESFIQTIKREISEECGIAEDQILRVEGPLYDFNWNKKGVEIREFVYAIEVDPAVLIKLAADEHDDYRWCNDDELVQTLETNNNKKAAYKVLEYLNGNKA